MIKKLIILVSFFVFLNLNLKAADAKLSSVGRINTFSYSNLFYMLSNSPLGSAAIEATNMLEGLKALDNFLKYDGSQFGSNGFIIFIKSGAFQTNMNFWGDGTNRNNLWIGGQLAPLVDDSQEAGTVGNAWFGLTAKSGGIKLMETGGGIQSITIKASAAMGASHALTLPNSQGAAKSVLTNDSSGNLGWYVPTITTIPPANLHSITLDKGWTNDIGSIANMVLSVKYVDSATGSPALGFTNSVTGEAWTNSFSIGLAATLQQTIVIPDIAPNDYGVFTNLSGSGATLTILNAWWKLK